MLAFLFGQYIASLGEMDLSTEKNVGFVYYIIVYTYLILCASFYCAKNIEY